jgi:hypothetical protein
MTNSKRLKVSLTKHGAHKLAILFKNFGSDEILDHLWGSIEDVNIEAVQAKKNLSVKDGVVPAVWEKARLLGSDAVNALVLLGIIFSHHKLIAAMSASTAPNTPLTGIVIRGQQLHGKAFTNFAHTLKELGYSTEHSKHHVRYDLTHLFAIKNLYPLAKELIELKLRTAGWTGAKPLLEELADLKFHEVFSLSQLQFKNWLTSGSFDVPEVATEDDLSFFEEASDLPTPNVFVFTSGHKHRKTGTVGVSRTQAATSAELLHNSMQNRLYASLVEKYGQDCVGTEIPTGAGTAIDIVVKTPDFCQFYEIKTASCVKACIRQALPQLLEYAYWHGFTDRADQLIIVGRGPVTNEATVYLALLRETFRIPIIYEQAPEP